MYKGVPMSFNEKLRKAVYGDPRASRTNPLLNMPAGVTGMTWQGTGFERAPEEPVELDEAALPWELKTEVPKAHLVQPNAESSFDRPHTTIHAGFGVSIVLGMIVVALIVVGAY